jgi:hypothetical protein
MLIGALDEAALLIASAEDQQAARRDAGLVASALVTGLCTTDHGDLSSPAH